VGETSEDPTEVADDEVEVPLLRLRVAPFIMVVYDIRYGLTGPFVPHVGCVRDPSPQIIFKRNGYNAMTVGFARGYAVIMQVRKNLLILKNDGAMLDRHQALMVPTAPLSTDDVEDWYEPVKEAGPNCSALTLRFYLRGFLQARDANGTWYTPRNLVAA
jgi:hypothetical protein